MGSHTVLHLLVGESILLQLLIHTFKGPVVMHVCIVSKHSLVSVFV